MVSVAVQPQLGSVLVEQPFGSYSAVRYNGAIGDSRAQGQYCAVYPPAPARSRGL